ncbi:MAG: hypothetical protein ACYTAF_10190 [Planctomycetota bacterium]|jgi:hypothetical protein
MESIIVPDGTLTAAFNIPRMAYAVWDPRAATVEARINEPLAPAPAHIPIRPHHSFNTCV